MFAVLVAAASAAVPLTPAKAKDSGMIRKVSPASAIIAGAQPICCSSMPAGRPMASWPKDAAAVPSPSAQERCSGVTSLEKLIPMIENPVAATPPPVNTPSSM